MSEYLLINIGIIAVPLLFTFEKKMGFYKKLSHIITSVLIVGLFYVMWDIYAAANFHWSFNPEFTGGIKLFGLPLEEILFFITVPYAMLFLYEVFVFYLNDKIKINRPKGIIFRILSLLFLISALLMINNAYTFIALISCAIYFFLAGSSYLSGIIPGTFWIFMSFSFIPFVIVNYFLTSLPIVLYNPEAITGYRFITIPMEDFLYSFSLISFYIMIYLLSIDMGKNRKKIA
jgi:lycopene cyclase domain-containing protein